jgi:polyisoprenyl-teichoic acid--peptidoglycan teichoic acid transferase
MKKIFKNISSNKLNLLFVGIFLLMLTLSTIYSLYAISLLTGIENLLRFIISLIVTVAWIAFIYYSYKVLNKNKFKKIVKLAVSIIVYSIIVGSCALVVDQTYGRLRRISNNSISFSSSLVVLKDSKYNSIEDMDDSKIAMFSDEKSTDGYILPQEIIKNLKLTNEIEYYDNYITMIDALLNGDIEYAFLPTNFEFLFQSINGYENLNSKTKIIYTYDKKILYDNTNSSITKPFTMLLMGVDSEKENIKSSSFNGDALMLITFNPQTFKSTILSIPRDSYVPISCFSGQRENKITHAAWYGQDCMIKTIENLFDVKIDYFLKMNFKGVVGLVDALKGIEVDVPYNFCEQNSDRKWGEDTIYVEKGLQKLNGEEVLALARNRHPNPKQCSEIWTDYVSNDFIRGNNQQLIINGVIGKLKDVRDINTVNKLIDTISSNLETNMNISEILSLYNIAKSAMNYSGDLDVKNVFGIQKLQLTGYDKMIVDYSLINRQGMKIELYNFIPYKGSVKDISEAMKINLNIIKEEPIKTFSFNVTVPYVERIVGKGSYNESAISLVPKFVGGIEDAAKVWADRNNIELEIEYITSSVATDFVGMVSNQTALAGMPTKYVGSKFKITVVEAINAPIEEEPTDEEPVIEEPIVEEPNVEVIE